MSMEGLRRGASNINQGKGTKGSVRSSYFTKWKPPQMSVGVGMGKARTTFDLRPFLSPPPHEEAKTEAAEPIALIAGKYEDVFAVDPNGNKITPSPTQEGLHIRVHNCSIFVKPRNPSERGYQTFREIVCSSGPEPHAPQPCVGCYVVDHGQKESRSKDNWVFNMAHLGWYHMIPFVKDGQIQMKKDGNGPILIKQECSTYKMENEYLRRAVAANRVSGDIAKKYKECEGCKQQAPFVWGDHRTLQLGFKHLKDIFAIDDMVGKKCINCGTGILRVAFRCDHCKNELLDTAQSGWTNDQIKQFMETQQTCACGYVGLPVSVYECGYDDNFVQVSEPCGNSQKTTIFDCVIWVQREGENMESKVVVKRVELLSQYKTPDNRPLSEHLKEIVKEPFNLVEMYKPDSVEDQAEALRIENPYMQTQQPQYASYGPPGGYQAPQPSTGTTPPGFPVPGRPNYSR